MKFLVVSDFETPFVKGKKSIHYDIIDEESKLKAVQKYFIEKYHSAKLDRDTNMFCLFINSFDDFNDFINFHKKYEKVYFQVIEIKDI